MTGGFWFASEEEDLLKNRILGRLRIWQLGRVEVVWLLEKISLSRLKLAKECGADDVISSGPDAAQEIRELSGGVGAAFVLDCVGVNATLETGVAALSLCGRLVMLGVGGGSIPFDFFKMPPGSQLVTSLNGGGVALKEVVDMAALGRIKSIEDRYPLSKVKQAYDDFEHGHLTGRAVVIPEGVEARPAVSAKVSL